MKDEGRSMSEAEGRAISSRRDWFRALMRWTALTALAALTTVLLGRRGVSTRTDDCERVLSCRDCAQLAGCGLPQARHQRHRARQARG
jgi:hypothetical protein